MKRLTCLLISFFLLFAVCGCNKKPEVKLATLLNKDCGKNVSFSGEAPDMSAYKAFSGDFLRKAYLLTSSGNTVVSPLSMYMAYELCYSGAKGDTRQEFERVFGNVHLSSYFNHIYSQGNFKESKFNVANSVWVNNDISKYVQNQFLSDASTLYNAQIYGADFANPKTVDDINAWVNLNTNGLIKKIVDELNKDNIMNLFNALSIESNWAKNYSATVNGKFLNSENKEVTANYLVDNQKNTFYESQNAEAFIEYLNDNLAFLGIRPKDTVECEDYFSNLDWNEIQTLLDAPNYDCEVHTKIPEFTTEYNIDLLEYMKLSGMTFGINPNLADFTGMIKFDDNRNAFISTAKQKTYFELDKNGIKAAAVTHIGMNEATSIGPGETIKIKEIFLDKPFAFVIMDTRRMGGKPVNIPLFMGTIKNI